MSSIEKMPSQKKRGPMVGPAVAVVAILFAPMGAQHVATAEPLAPTQVAPPQAQSSENQSSEKPSSEKPSSEKPSSEKPSLKKQKPKVISPAPGEILRPFNGQDLTGFTPWLQGIGTEVPDDSFLACERQGHGLSGDC